MALSMLLVFVAIFSAIFFWSRKSSHPPKPPGPRPFPLIGNIFDLTTSQLWLRATEWAKRYGDVVYVHVFGQGLLFLNTAKAASELMEQRIYSDKPPLVMCGELCGCQDMVAFTRYGDQMKRQRKLMQGALGSASIPNYYPLLKGETCHLLDRLLAEPQDYVSHIRRYAGGLTLHVVYGYEAKANDDSFLLLADHCVDLLSNEIASGGGIWPVDIFPFLRHLPEWLPGTSFLRKARVWRAKMLEFVDKPFEYVKESMRNGTAVPSFCSTLLENGGAPVGDLADLDIRWTANSMYSASIDTTMTVVLHFFLAMIQNPDVLAKAQKEIDMIVGNDRLPTFADREKLPYLDCVFNECLRWGVPVPLSLPHRLMEDDVYEGKFIPKGSLVFANVWNILRDETLFTDADKFNPDRYSEVVDKETAKRRDPKNYVFGFGRRICPGKALVHSSIWVLIASIIATSNIKKAVDGEGNPIEPEVVFDNAVFRLPKPFKLDIQPRFQNTVNLVKEAIDNGSD